MSLIEDKSNAVFWGVGGFVVFVLYFTHAYINSEIPNAEYKEVRAIIQEAKDSDNQVILKLIAEKMQDGEISISEKNDILKASEKLKVKEALYGSAAIKKEG